MHCSVRNQFIFRFCRQHKAVTVEKTNCRLSSINWRTWWGDGKAWYSERPSTIQSVSVPGICTQWRGRWHLHQHLRWIFFYDWKINFWCFVELPAIIFKTLSRWFTRMGSQEIRMRAPAGLDSSWAGEHQKNFATFGRFFFLFIVSVVR